MRLTAKDIYDKTFKRSFKGYDDAEVDDFLDIIIKDFVEMTEEISRLKEDSTIYAKENAEMKKALSELKEQYSTKLSSLQSEQKSFEERTMQTLLAAQKTAEILLGEARAKADEIINQANARAKHIDETYEQKFEVQRRNAGQLKELVAQCKNEYEFLLEKNRRMFTDKSSEILQVIESFDIEFKENEVPEMKMPPQASAAAKHPEFSIPEMPAKQQNQAHDDMATAFLSRSSVHSSATASLVDEIVEERKPEDFNASMRDYSWIYDEEEKTEVIDVPLPPKSPKAERELADLISEVVQV